MSYEYNRRKVARTVPFLWEVKQKWAEQLAQAMADRFTNYGGWRDFKVKTTVHSSGGGVSLQVRSDLYGWTGNVSIFEHGDTIEAMFDADEELPEGDIDLLKVLQQADDSTKSFPVTDRSNPDDLVMGVSLWFSKFLNKMPRK